MTVNHFVGFCVSDLDSNTILIGQKSHIKYLFVCIFYHIYNLRYSKYLNITNYVGLCNLFLLLASILDHPLLFLAFRFLCNVVPNQ